MLFSIGICAYNESVNIGNLLTNILYKQKTRENFEVLVVCSGCTDNTEEIVRSFSNKDSRVKLLVEQKRNGKVSAINKILANVTGDSIIFISADTLPQEGCFSKMLKRIQEPNVGIVCAKPVPINHSGSLADRMVHVLWSIHDNAFRELNDAGLAKHASEAFIIRRNIAEKIPQTVVNDDSYIALTAKRKGWLIKYEPTCRVLIRGPETLADYFKQRRRIIFGHHQTKKMTGVSPQYFILATGSYPGGLIRLFRLLDKENSVFSIFMFLFFEATLNAMSIFDSLMQKSYSTWSIANTTKKGPVDI